MADVDHSRIARLASFMLRHPAQPENWAYYARRIGANQNELGVALRTYAALAHGVPKRSGLAPSNGE